MVRDEIFVLTVASVMVLAILLFLLLYLIIRKGIENRNRKQIEQFKEKMNPLLFTYISEGELSRGLHPDTQVKEQALEELLKHYADILEGEEEQRHVNVLATQHLTDYYRQSLRSFRWSRRMNALYHIEDFKMKQMQGDIEAIIVNPKSTIEELMISLRILAAFQYPNLASLLIESWNHLTENDYRSILFRMDRPQLEELILAFNQASDPLKFALIEVISIKNEVSYVWFLEAIFAANDGELRLRALKAISAIGYVSTIDPYLPLFQSTVWQERMMVVKLCGSLKVKELLPQLSSMLSDSSWWVRFQAGQSIMMFPDGKAILTNVYHSTEDPFVRDMALEWMNKGAI